MKEPTKKEWCRSCGVEFPQTDPYKFTCPPCEKKEREEDAERNLGRIREKIRDATPPRFRATDPAHPSFNRDAWEAVKAWRPTRERPWLGMFGPTGTCKSRIAYLAAALELERMTDRERFPSFAFVTSYEIGEAVMRQFSDERGEKSEARKDLDHLRRCRLLFIDDLGKGRLTPAVAAELFALIDHRHAHCAVTIWTSNSTPEAIAEGMSEDMAGPFAGRINECSKIFSFE